MASNFDFVEFVCEQIRDAGNISYRKMFGEYALYCESKVIGLICENQLFLKKTKKIGELYPDLKEGSPYKGSSPYFIVEDLDNPQKLCEIIQIAYEELPEPKPKKKKEKQ